MYHWTGISGFKAASVVQQGRLDKLVFVYVIPIGYVLYSTWTILYNTSRTTLQIATTLASYIEHFRKIPIGFELNSYIRRKNCAHVCQLGAATWKLEVRNTCIALVTFVAHFCARERCEHRRQQPSVHKSAHYHLYHHSPGCPIMLGSVMFELHPL